MEEKTMLTLESFEQASEIVKQVTQETKLIKSSYFSELTGNKVYLKPENMQRTGHIRFVVLIIRSALFPMKREIKV